MELTSNQIKILENIYKGCKYDKKLVKLRTDVWYNDVSPYLSLPDYLVDLSEFFKGWSRKSLYELITTYVVKRPDENKLSIAIPDGNGSFLTIARGSQGGLMIGDHRYASKNKLKSHNSCVPGGITMTELNDSGLGWCLQFAERLNNEQY